MKHIKRVAKAAAILTAFSILTRAIGFFYRIYLSREAGAEAIGLFQIATSVFSVCITLTSSGIPVTVSRLTARAEKRGDTLLQNRTVSAALTVALFLSVSLSAILLLLKNHLGFLFSDSRCLPVFFSLLPAFLASAVYSALRGGLWGRRRYVSYALTELCEEVSIVLVGVMILQGKTTSMQKAVAMAQAVSISYISAALLTVVLYLVRKGKICLPRAEIKPLVQAASPITAVRLCNCLQGSLLAIILPASLVRGGMTASEALSLFGVMTGMTMPLLFLPFTFTGSVSMALVPEISVMAEQQEKKRLTEQIDSAFCFCLAVATVILPGYLCVGRELCVALFHNEAAGKLLQINALLMLPMSLQGISTTVLNSLGKEYRALLHFGVSSALYLISVIFLPSRIGILGMTSGLALSLTTECVLHLIALKRLSIKGLTCFKRIAALLPFCLLAGAIGYFCKELTLGFLPLLIASVIGFGASTGVMLLGTLILGIFPLPQKLKKWVWHKLPPKFTANTKKSQTFAHFIDK